jgi:glycosyltransferase involved in cell wall biosynthesis
VPRPWALAIDSLPVSAGLLRLALTMRHARRVSDGFDVLVGGQNETDFGRRGIQYVHYPTYLRPRPDVDYRWYHHAAPPLLHVYYRWADRLAGVSMDGVRRNLTLANSNWTAARVKQLLGIEARTLYPPVADPAPPLAWSERTNTVVALGRISPEKEYERAMRVLARVRRHVPDLTFTIVGTCDRHTTGYLHALRRLAATLGSWIQFWHDPPRDELRRFLATSRWGIHAMREEHFGMAPAEMVRAGLVVWVPRGGGALEIVGDEPALHYESDEEAVEKIARVMTSAHEQTRVREHLARQAERFGTESFMDDIRSVVDSFRE